MGLLDQIAAGFGYMPQQQTKPKKKPQTSEMPQGIVSPPPPPTFKNPQEKLAWENSQRAPMQGNDAMQMLMQMMQQNMQLQREQNFNELNGLQRANIQREQDRAEFWNRPRDTSEMDAYTQWKKEGGWLGEQQRNMQTQQTQGAQLQNAQPMPAPQTPPTSYTPPKWMNNVMPQSQEQQDLNQRNEMVDLAQSGLNQFYQGGLAPELSSIPQVNALFPQQFTQTGQGYAGANGSPAIPAPAQATTQMPQNVAPQVQRGIAPTHLERALSIAGRRISQGMPNLLDSLFGWLPSPKTSYAERMQKKQQNVPQGRDQLFY
jgi:hypothetical protein